MKEAAQIPWKEMATLAAVILAALIPLYFSMRGFPYFVARRYLFSRKHRGAINIITLISIAGILVVTGALILTMSVFNGFQGMIEGLYTSWDPDVKIVAARGRAFDDTPEIRSLLASDPGIEAFAPSLENKAMLTYFDKQFMVTLKGIGQDMLKVRRLDTLLYDGEFKFDSVLGIRTAILGSTVGYYLNARLTDRVHPIKIWAAPENTGQALETDLEKAVKTDFLFPNGYFSVQMEYDMKYVLADIEQVRSLFDFRQQATAYEIRLKDFDKAQEVKNRLQESLGDKFRVLTWYEQHQTLFDVMKNEKRVAFLILTLMLLIAGVNIVGSLSMIILEKSADIAVLRSAGATQGTIVRIFLTEGIFVGGIGGITGMAAAGIITWLQIKFGLFKLNGGETFSHIDAFPIEPLAWDYVAIFITVFSVSILAALYPARKAARAQIVPALKNK